MMIAALRFSTVSLLTPLMILLSQSKGLVLPSGQALRAVGPSSYERAATAAPAVAPCRSKYLGLQQRKYTAAAAAAAAVAEAATAAAYYRRGTWRKERRGLKMSAGGGGTAGDIDAGGDVRKVWAFSSTITTAAVWNNRCSTASRGTCSCSKRCCTALWYCSLGEALFRACSMLLMPVLVTSIGMVWIVPSSAACRTYINGCDLQIAALMRRFT